MAYGGLTRDAIQPERQLSRLAQPIYTLQYLYPALLKDLLGSLLIIHEPANVIEEPFLPASHQLF
jgi:hypothetical protein